MSAQPGERARTAAVVLALSAAVLAVYAETRTFDFVRYDDPDYVLENPHVRQGLTWAGVRWAFLSLHASNWHPLTWLAHMLDVELYGLAPGGHHLSSVLLHALGSVLCFLAVRALARDAWIGAGVAFLFALHPLRVESVAWISERKDVLAGVFFFATLHAYVRHARAPAPGRLAWVALLYALGLLAKPMLVSVPLVLLALDAWPLGRWAERGARRLVLEKLPLAALALASALLTLHAQQAGGALQALELLSLSERLANAPLALLGYLGHFLAPVDLSYFYPHRALQGEHASPWDAAAWLAVALVLALSVVVCARARAWPALAVGWAWFLAMIAPVLGLVQVGEQAMADRYAYLPLVGPQLALAWAWVALARRRPGLRVPLAAGAALVLLACGFASARQARVWRDSESLFRHAIRVDAENHAAWAALANELATAGQLDEARQAYERALALRADEVSALYGLGLLEQQHGDRARALELYRAAIAAQPGFAAAYLNLGSLLAAQGETGAAAEAFERVLALAPEHPDAHFDLALLFLLHDDFAHAIPHLERAVRSRPDFSVAWEMLGEAHERLGAHAPAIAALTQAARDPTRGEAARLLAWILASAGEEELRDPARALTLARRAVATTGRRDARALEALAAALAASGDFARAAEVQDEAVQLLAPGQQGAARARLEGFRRAEPFRHAH